MPYNQVYTYTTTGTKASVGLDPAIAPFDVGISCELSSGGSVSYKLQYTYNTLGNPLDTDSNATWFDSTDIPAGTNDSKASNITAPTARVRLVIASLTGSLTLRVLQGLSTN